MGIANGDDNRLVMQGLFVFLAERFGIRNFVETGTYRGETARFASEHFERVITVEGSESLFRVAQQQLDQCSNTECLCGDSRTHLSRIIGDLSGPSLFWLDAHWSGGETFGDQAECPLMEELAAIYNRSCDSFTIIDDARFFVSLPPQPHEIHFWPTYFEIADTVRQRAPLTWMTLYADAIVLAPPWAAEALIPYLRQPLPTGRLQPRGSRWFPWRKSQRKSA